MPAPIEADIGGQMTPVRIVVAIVFFAVMFGVSRFVHWAVEDSLLWGIVIMGGLMSWAVIVDNRDRRREGRPSLSIAEARAGTISTFYDMRWLLFICGTIIAVGYLLR